MKLCLDFYSLLHKTKYVRVNSMKNLTSGLGTDNTIQTIWIVASGMALTDLDNGRTIGLTEKDIKRYLDAIVGYLIISNITLHNILNCNHDI